MADANKPLVRWLKDAHAMEKSLEKTLAKQADHASDDAAMHDRLNQHVEETRRHAELVEDALDRLGADTSSFKDTMSKAQSTLHGMVTGGSDDTLIKDALSCVGAEHFEIACYISIRAAARELGDQRTVEMCDRILADERDMAEFLEAQIERITSVELAGAAS